MKLIMENALLLEGLIIDEINEKAGTTEKSYFLEGIFTTPDTKNRNGRVYPRAIWEREVKNYQKEIEGKSINSLSEYQHPPRSTVDPMKAVGRITELAFREDGNVWGKVKILNDNSHQTNKLKSLIKEGIKIGISTRGVGKVSASGMVEDFKLITADIVDMPSDYNAMLNGMVEGVQLVEGIAQDHEYYVDDNGCIGQCSLEESNKEGIYKNVESLREILKEKNADKLCDLSLEEKEEVLGKFLDAVNEEKSYNVPKEKFNAKEFQDWIARDLGETETKNETTIYKNKAGANVFMYDSENQSLTIVQKDLDIKDLESYGLVESKSFDEAKAKALIMALKSVL